MCCLYIPNSTALLVYGCATHGAQIHLDFLNSVISCGFVLSNKDWAFKNDRDLTPTLPHNTESSW